MAAGDAESPDFHEALATLCKTYWYPLYTYVRRSGHDAHQAQDLCQDFFVDLLEKDRLKVVERGRGSFRSFLRTAVKNFLSKKRDEARSQKRGGGRVPFSLDFDRAETRYKMEPSHGWTAEALFERRWTLTVLDNSLRELRRWCECLGKAHRFDELKSCLAGTDSRTYSEIAAELGMSESAVKQEVRRLRKRCRDMLRRQIADTVADPDEINEELRRLFRSLGE